MPARILLLRHASHDRVGAVLCGRMPGVTLGEAGRAEATALATALAEEHVDALHTSPMLRCRQTADALAARLGVVALPVEAITEIDYGIWTGQRFDSLAEDPGWHEWNHARDAACPPDGEPMHQAQRRAVDHVQSLADAGGTVALVSHSDIIKAVLCHCLGLPLQAYWRFDIDTASISEIEWHAGHAIVRGINRPAPRARTATGAET